MPFGAELSADGSTRFRLWASGARRVDLDLSLGNVRGELPMTALDGGWFETRVPNVPAGARYGFRIDGGITVADPASRCNPDDVHAASMVIDPCAFDWSDAKWAGRPWEEAIIYEVHLGTFTPAGTFTAAVERLDYLADLGVTAIELMPLADFPGRCNWGYDGVLPFAPDAAYGTPADLKRLVDAAHARRISVFLDVVYNHFGPEGNYLHTYAPFFFNHKRRTPWGDAINFDGEGSRTVRDFFIHNALYWLEEYSFDGLRLDAVDHIIDDSAPNLVAELAAAVREGPGAARHVHLVLENDRNEARYLGRDAQFRPLHATAQWNDDLHHALHVFLTGEADGYYADYADEPLRHFGRCLAEGFAYQGEWSRYRGVTRGEPSLHLPPAAFVSFLQTHDQVGNRAFGERIGQLVEPRALRTAIACMLLAPSPPLLFMGEEFGASTPFLFFCDFTAELAAAVRCGRRREFQRFARFADPATLAAIPDPNLPATFEKCKLDWSEIRQVPHGECHAFWRNCLRLRSTYIVPRLAGMAPSGAFAIEHGRVLYIHWTLGDGSHLHLCANFDANAPHRIERPPGQVVYASEAEGTGAGDKLLLPQSVLCTLAKHP
ncbi:MAG TPA: malto-oligosyltrehalose trehalohydrolase [Casimicrobiaceae bacterium]|jgi:malto-oligosyltrehalose trehalohydrolase|nr:malto-oligosyltrehalose trehalohydrolase [Casimicrobiaceae bacterium]